MALTPRPAAGAFTARLQQAVSWFHNGRFAEAEQEGRQLFLLDPSDIHVLVLLATLAQDRGDWAEAIEFWRLATRAPRAAATHWNSLGRAYAFARKFHEAQAAFGEAVRLEPTFTDAVNNLGLTFQDLGDYDRATHYLRAAIRLNPQSPLAHCNLGHLLNKCGHHAEAIGCFNEALRVDPVSAAAANGLGMTLQLLGDVVSAEHYYREALRVEPRFADASNNLATALKELGRFDEAIAQFRETLKLAPQHPQTMYNLSQFVAENRFAFEPQHLADIQAIIGSGAGSDLDRSLLGFSLAAYHEAKQSYDEAFSNYRQANELRKRIQPFDSQKHADLVERIINTMDADYFRQVRGWSRGSRMPIFVVGMPRTGSTLVEQILATDANVYAAGELGEIPQMMARLSRDLGDVDLYTRRLPLGSQAEAHDFADRYLAHLGKISRQAPFVTIKTLENFLHLGVIATLFPEARIVHCVRDPLDVCVSCYCQNFVSLDFSWDLLDIAGYYRAYERLNQHWQRVLPVRMHQVKYEELIHSPEKVTRGLFEHCGLNWSPRCLRFFENKGAVRTASAVQVRKPLSAKSIGRWRRFRDHLQPLFAALGRGIPELGADSGNLSLTRIQPDVIG